MSLLLSLVAVAAAAPRWTPVADRPDAAVALRTDDDACVRSATTTLPGRSPEVSWATWGACMAERGWVWTPRAKNGERRPEGVVSTPDPAPAKVAAR